MLSTFFLEVDISQVYFPSALQRVSLILMSNCPRVHQLNNTPLDWVFALPNFILPVPWLLFPGIVPTMHYLQFLPQILLRHVPICILSSKAKENLCQNQKSLVKQSLLSLLYPPMSHWPGLEKTAWGISKHNAWLRGRSWLCNTLLTAGQVLDAVLV